MNYDSRASLSSTCQSRFGRPLGESELYGILVGFAGADYPDTDWLAPDLSIFFS
jgi:hypothetical protein